MLIKKHILYVLYNIISRLHFIHVSKKQCGRPDLNEIVECNEVKVLEFFEMNLRDWVDTKYTFYILLPGTYQLSHFFPSSHLYAYVYIFLSLPLFLSFMELPTATQAPNNIPV